jgi:hypothetical protein
LAQRNGTCPVSSALDESGALGDAARAETSAHLAQFARWEFDTPGVQLGARYDGSPIVASDGGAIPADSPILYIPSGVPGGRLPHVWLRDGRSLFDRLGPEFTLIQLKSVGADERWRAAAEASRIELAILNLPDEDRLASLIGTEGVLVRPDQHIAWRGAVGSPDAESILRVAAGKDH